MDHEWLKSLEEQEKQSVKKFRALVKELLDSVFTIRELTEKKRFSFNYVSTS